MSISEDKTPAEDSAAKHRAKQTVVNLALSIIATLGIVLITILIVPRDDSNRIKPVDYMAVSVAAEASSNLNLIAPALPEGWWANQARWSTAASDGVLVWKVGFVGPDNQYIGLTQAFKVNPTWVALRTQGFESDPSATNAISDWKFLKPDANTDADPYLWTLERDGNFVSLTSTATLEELAIFASLIEQELIK
jgi:hypothetical protein